MKNSIEAIWKEGFLSEKNLVVPKINDLYNQKSKHVVDNIRRMFRINLIVIVVLSIILPIVHYFVDAFWQGVATSILLLFTGWYNKLQMNGIKALDPGATSFDYLKSFDGWLRETLSRSEKLMRFSYPLYFLIAVSTIWSTWNNQEKLIMATRQRFSGSIFIANVPLFAIIVVGIVTVLMFLFADRIYKWDIRLMYGRVFAKLEETIAEMEELRQGK